MTAEEQGENAPDKKGLKIVWYPNFIMLEGAIELFFVWKPFLDFELFCKKKEDDTLTAPTGMKSNRQFPAGTGNRSMVCISPVDRWRSIARQDTVVVGFAHG